MTSIAQCQRLESWRGVAYSTNRVGPIGVAAYIPRQGLNRTEVNQTQR
jgi:hypothetical protein